MTYRFKGLVLGPQPNLGKSFTKEEDDFIVASRNQQPPMSYDTIGGYLGRHSKSVQDRFKRLEFGPPSNGSKPFSREEDEFIMTARGEAPPADL